MRPRPHGGQARRPSIGITPDHSVRDNGFASVRSEGTRRLYSVETGRLREVDAWLEQFRGFWENKLDALATEIARGKRKRR